MVGVLSGSLSLMSIITMQKFGRRSLTLVGTVLASFAHYMIYQSIIDLNGQFVVYFMLLFQASLSMFITPAHWIYLSETLNDQQFGLISALHYSGGAIISVSAEFLWSWLQPSGMFLLFSIYSLFYTAFLFVFFKETKGLTDKEKKELFIPAKIKEIMQK